MNRIENQKDLDKIRLEERLRVFRQREQEVLWRAQELTRQKKREQAVILKEIENRTRDYRINRKIYSSNSDFDVQERARITNNYNDKRKELESVFRRIGNRFDAQVKDTLQDLSSVRKEMAEAKKQFKREQRLRRENEKTIMEQNLEI